MPKIKRICPCGTEFERYLYPSNQKRGAKGLYCSLKCVGKYVVKHSEESNKKIAKTLTGRKLSEDTRNKMRLAWTDERRQLASQAKKGRKVSDETREKLRLSKLGKPSPMLGKKQTEEHIRKRVEKVRGKQRVTYRKADLWKNIKGNYKYKSWRKEVFERDNYTCQHCKSRGGNLEADHIKPKAMILREHNITTLEEALNCVELWNLDNGRTLCKPCHRKTDTFGWNQYNKKK